MSRGLLWSLALAAAGCTSFEQQVVFKKGMEFAAPEDEERTKVSAHVLNEGREAYMEYCFNCHGIDGDGQGPAGVGMRPPPRDFRTGVFKFARVIDGLPHDEDLAHIVRGGLQGTAMLPWDDVPEEQLHAILQYIKTLSPIWSDPEEILGERVLAEEDPWGPEKAAEAIARGRAMYHGFAGCQGCHAAYATREEIYRASAETGQPVSSFRDHLYEPEAKVSDIRDGEIQMRLVPPDFLWNDVRAGSTVEDLFRTIAAGVPPVMPKWKGSGLEDQDIWAIAYYVSSLIEMRGTPEAAALQARLANQRPFEIPAPPAPAAPAAAPTPAAPAPAAPAAP